MAPRINIPTRLSHIRRAIQSAFGLIMRVGIFLLISIGGGTASSWYAIEHGMPFNTERQGPWTRWSGAGKPGSDPYSRNRFAGRAQLLYNADLTARFEALTDAKGRRLHSSCDYVIEGRDINVPWWSLAVFDSRGRLIPNPARRYAFSSTNVAHSPDGSFAIRLSREARPYNWLPTTRAGQIVLIFEAQKRSGGTDVLERTEIQLPTIRRIDCR
ncbi:MAG: DUF1214 domain-containing protein [Hyphomicrobiaceae bacterium]